MEYVYIIRSGKDRSVHDNVYKIGQSINFTRRFTEYEFCSQIIACVPVINSINVERLLIKRLKQTYELHRGREYFIVDNAFEFINIFFEVVTPYIPSPDTFDNNIFKQNEEHQLHVELWLKNRRNKYRNQTLKKERIENAGC
jgi:hypothetical protein